MLKWKHLFLGVGIVAVVLGVIRPYPTMVFDLGLPVGAILIGFSLIVHAMEKELTRMRRQQRAEENRRKATLSPDAGGSVLVQALEKEQTSMLDKHHGLFTPPRPTASH